MNHSMPTSPMTAPPHRRLFRAALSACALLLAAACAPAGDPASGPAPAGASTQLAPAAWNAQSSAAEIARWTRQGCRRAPGGKDACVERTLVTLIDQAGIGKTMEVLDTLVIVDDDVRLNAHALAHGLGISAYRSPETLARTFAACPPSQMSGCYHGVIQGYFLALNAQGRPVGTAEMDALCAPHRDSSFLYFQCAHGVGHGLMAIHENHVPMSLEGCDLATDVFIRESCYGGVFMENIVHVTHPHHTAEGHAGTQGGAHGGHGQAASADAHAAHGQPAAADGHAAHGAQQTASAGHDAHAGHAATDSASAGHDAHAAHGAQTASAGHDGHAGHGAAPGPAAMQHGEWRALNRNDWLYPCNAVAEKYMDSCYTMQTSAVMYFNYGDVGSTARVCERAPAQYHATCFMSLGRDVTAFAAQDHQRSIDLCSRTGDAAGGRGRTWCTLGVAQNLMNVSADPREGIRFCRAVAGADKGECYRVAGEGVRVMVAGADARAQACQSAESDFVAVCRRAAGVEPRSAGSE
jgi:hypothetical protein